MAREFGHCSIRMRMGIRSKGLDAMGAPLDLRLALLIARTHRFLGEDELALQYAEWGLKNIGRAEGLIKDFEGLIRRN